MSHPQQKASSEASSGSPSAMSQIFNPRVGKHLGVFRTDLSIFVKVQSTHDVTFDLIPVHLQRIPSQSSPHKNGFTFFSRFSVKGYIPIQVRFPPHYTGLFTNLDAHGYIEKLRVLNLKQAVPTCLTFTYSLWAAI